MICSTILLATVLNAEELTAAAPTAAPVVDEIESSELELDAVSMRMGRRLVGPRWTWDKTFEMPAGMRDNGSSKSAYYTQEQQARLGVDESGYELSDLTGPRLHRLNAAGKKRKFYANFLYGPSFVRRLPGDNWLDEFLDDFKEVQDAYKKKFDAENINADTWLEDFKEWQDLLLEKFPALKDFDWTRKDLFDGIPGDWDRLMPRFTRDPSFEKPAGDWEWDPRPEAKWYYTAEQQGRLGVDRNGADLPAVGADWEEQMPRFVRDPSFEMPEGEENQGTSSTAWFYTPEQQARLGVDRDGEDARRRFYKRSANRGGDVDEHGCKPSAGYTFCKTLGKCIRGWEETCPETAIIGADWEKQMPRYVRDPSFEMPAGTKSVGTSTIKVYTAEQQARLSVDERGEQCFGCGRDTHGCIPSAGFRWCESLEKCIFLKETCPSRRLAPVPVTKRVPVVRTRTPQRIRTRFRSGMPGQCQCSNGLTGMLTSEGCICQKEKKTRCFKRSGCF